MSILFDHAIRNVDVGAGELYSAEEPAIERVNDVADHRVPVRPIAAFESQHDELAHPSKDWTCIPLHGADTAVPEPEFVGYTDHDLQGEVFVVERDGTYRFRVDVDEDLTTRRDDDWSFFVECEFGIHEGNEVLLHAPADTRSPGAFPLPATVAKIRGLTIWLAIDWADVAEATTVGNELAHGNAGYGLSSRLNPVPFDREATAVDELAGHPLGEVLAGERPVTFTNGAEARSSPCDTALNQAQQLAVRFALLADDVFCIHGPPGTGKTRTLVEIVRRAADAGETVLVSLVRSNDDGDGGFLWRPKDGPRRLNVALTRAKRYCAVVADWHTLRSDRKGKCTDLYRTLYAHFDDQGRMNDVDPTFIPVQWAEKPSKREQSGSN